MDFAEFTPEFYQKFQPFETQVLTDLKVRFLAIQGFISIFKQALLWRSGHNDNEIDSMIQALKEQKCYNMANLIAQTTALPGPKTTDILPGCSWHNWGEALLFHLIDEDNKVLSLDHKKYTEVAKIAKKHDLISGLFFKNDPVPNLLQLSTEPYPIDKFSLKEIDKKLKELGELNYDIN